MIEINEPEYNEFKVNYHHVCLAVANDPANSVFANAVKETKKAKAASADWQDYNYFSGVLVDAYHQEGIGSAKYQVLPKSLAVSLCRAIDHDTALRNEIYEKFKDVVWTLQQWR